MEVRLAFSNNQLNKLLYGLVAIEVLFVLIFFIDYLLGTPIWIIHTYFYLDGEMNIPAWFSSIQLSLVGIVFLLRAYQPVSSDYPSPVFMLMLGAGFLFLSADELTKIHETFSKTLKSIEWVPRFKGGNGLWISVYLLLCLTFVLTTYRHFCAMWNLYRKESFFMMTGIMVFLLGAVGFEIISYQFLRDDTSSMLYQVEVAVEEFLEMMGISLVLYGSILFSAKE